MMSYTRSCSLGDHADRIDDAKSKMIFCVDVLCGCAVWMCVYAECVIFTCCALWGSREPFFLFRKPCLAGGGPWAVGGGPRRMLWAVGCGQWAVGRVLIGVRILMLCSCCAHVVLVCLSSGKEVNLETQSPQVRNSTQHDSSLWTIGRRCCALRCCAVLCCAVLWWVVDGWMVGGGFGAPIRCRKVSNKFFPLVNNPAFTDCCHKFPPSGMVTPFRAQTQHIHSTDTAQPEYIGACNRMVCEIPFGGGLLPSSTIK